MATREREKELDSNSAAFLRNLQEAPPLDWSADGIRATRDSVKATQIQCFERPLGRSVRTEYLNIAGSAGEIPISIKSPAHGDVVSSVALFIHGGGWISGDLETHAPFVDRLVAASHGTVVSVDYRLAPEHRFPAGLEDCFTALKWVSRRFNQAPAVIGDSAGGNLAAALCLMGRDHGPPVDRQILICPVIDPGNYSIPSRMAFGGGDFLLSNDEMRQMIDHYTSCPEDVENPLISPIKVTSAKGLPRALVITAECDMLLDEGRAYADRLGDDGVTVDYKMFRRTIHDFPIFGDAIPKSYDGIRLVADFLGTRP